MHDQEYGLGIDVGDRTVVAAVCGHGGRAEPLPLPRGGDHGLPGVVGHAGTATPVLVGDQPVVAADVLADVVRRVRDAAAEQVGTSDVRTVVTVPPSWDDSRRAGLADSLRRAGVPRVTLLSSAVAATAHHVAVGRLPARPTVAVYDLGARTLDRRARAGERPVLSCG